MTRYIAILALTLPVALSSDYLSCFGQEANFLAYSNLVERPLDADNMSRVDAEKYYPVAPLVSDLLDPEEMLTDINLVDLGDKENLTPFDIIDVGDYVDILDPELLEFLTVVLEIQNYHVDIHHLNINQLLAGMENLGVSQDDLFDMMAVGFGFGDFLEWLGIEDPNAALKSGQPFDGLAGVDQTLEGFSYRDDAEGLTWEDILAGETGSSKAMKAAKKGKKNKGKKSKKDKDDESDTEGGDDFIIKPWVPGPGDVYGRPDQRFRTTDVVSVIEMLYLLQIFSYGY